MSGLCKAREIRDEWDATALKESTVQSWGTVSSGIDIRIKIDKQTKRGKSD